MRDASVSVSRIVTIAAWSLGGVMLVTTWMVLLWARLEVAVAFAFTTMVVIGLAMVATMRCYMLGVTRLLRAVLANGSSGEDAELRAVR